MAYMAMQPGADVAMTNCEAHNVGFYEKCGWRFAENVLLVGSHSAPEVLDERLAIRCLSAKAQRFSHELETVPIYFEEEW